MTSGVISFSCSSCGVRLTVPDSMAGISGPCPKCSATIQAPSPALAQAPRPVPTELPVPATSPVSSFPASAPAPLTKPVPKQAAEMPAGSIRPEPRAIPERQASKVIATRHTTHDESLRKSQTAPPRSRSRSADIGLGLSRVLIPLFFLIAGGAIVFLLCYHFLPGGPGETLRRFSKPPSDSPAKTQPTSPEQAATSNTFSPEESPATTSGVVPDAPPISADGATAIRAEQVLDEFLATSLLDERLSLIDPPLSAAELEGTILDMPLPEVINVSPETPAFDPVENLGDFPFRVSFQGGEGSIVEYTVLVRQRAELEPKVVVGPLLDLVGGRLERFASTPTEGAQTFSVILEAMPRCFEENIPNPSKKFTYKLSGSKVGRTIARAYASLNSSLAEQLWTPDSRIRWGTKIRATVTLQWNTREDPSQPYIELMEIKGLDWNS